MPCIYATHHHCCPVSGAAMRFIYYYVSLVTAVMSVRMMVLAESHRKKMREYNNIKTNRTADSMRFIFILITTFIISTIIPGTSP